MNEKVFGTGEVAKRLGIPRWKLTQLIELGKLPEASGKVEGRRLFSLADVEAVTGKYRELCQAKAEKEGLAKATLVG
jgi:DNA-binding transcriptional MerR regulator